jgi:hypothetical protein
MNDRDSNLYGYASFSLGSHQNWSVCVVHLCEPVHTISFFWKAILKCPQFAVQLSNWKCFWSFLFEHCNSAYFSQIKF